MEDDKVTMASEPIVAHPMTSYNDVMGYLHRIRISPEVKKSVAHRLMLEVTGQYLSKTFERLDHLCQLQDDWDGYGAIRPLSECLNHALEIVRNKKINLDFLTDIYPNPNGTLSLEWEQDDNEIGLELGKEEFSFFAHFGELHSYNNKKRYAAEEIERLAEFVSYLR